MDSLELVKDMLTSINACGGLYIEEIIGKYNGKCELPFVLDMITQSLIVEHTHACDCLSGTKIVISNKGKDYLNTICKEGALREDREPQKGAV